MLIVFWYAYWVALFHIQTRHILRVWVVAMPEKIEDICTFLFFHLKFPFALTLLERLIWGTYAKWCWLSFSAFLHHGCFGVVRAWTDFCIILIFWPFPRFSFPISNTMNSLKFSPFWILRWRCSLLLTPPTFFCYCPIYNIPKGEYRRPDPISI